MNMRDIEQLISKLPSATLSSERDRLIRQAIAMQAVAPQSHMRSWFTVPQISLAFASLLVAVVGVGGYAYASPSVTHGDALYGTKRVIERVRGSWQRTPLQRVRFHSDLALRRLSEFEALLSERGRANGIAFIPVAHAQTGGDAIGSANPGASEAIVVTATEVTAETKTAAEAAQQVTDPAVARQVMLVLGTNQTQVSDRLTAAAGVAGIGNAAVVDAIAQAIEAVRKIATATEASKLEIEMAVKRGEREVRVTIIVRREEAGDAAEVREDLAAQRQEFAELRAKLTAAGVPAEKVARFLERIGGKLDQVEAAITAGNLHQAEGLLEAAEALRKNAKHFLKATERTDDRQEDATERLDEQTERSERSGEQRSDERQRTEREESGWREEDATDDIQTDVEAARDRQSNDRGMTGQRRARDDDR